MKATAGFLGIVLALGAALYVYNAQLTHAGGGTAPPQEQIDVTGIRMALLEIGHADRSSEARLADSVDRRKHADCRTLTNTWGS